MSEEEDDLEFEVPDCLDAILLLIIIQDRMEEMIFNYEDMLKTTYHPKEVLTEMGKFFRSKQLALAIGYISYCMFRADPEYTSDKVRDGFKSITTMAHSYKAMASLNRNLKEVSDWLSTADLENDVKSLTRVSKALNFVHQTYFLEAIGNELVELPSELAGTMSSDLY